MELPGKGDSLCWCLGCGIFDLPLLPAHGLRGELSSSLQAEIGSGSKSGSPGANLNPGFAPSVGEEMDLWGLLELFGQVIPKSGPGTFGTAGILFPCQ